MQLGVPAPAWAPPTGAPQAPQSTTPAANSASNITAFSTNPASPKPVDTEKFLKVTLAALHQTLLTEINTALASVVAHSQQLSQTRCEVCGFSGTGLRHEQHAPHFKSHVPLAPPLAIARPESGHRYPENLPGQLSKEPAGKPEPDNAQLSKAGQNGGTPQRRGSVFTESWKGDADDADFVKTLFKKIDADNSGDVTKTEFLRAFKTDDVVIEFCKENPKLKPLLNFKNFKEAFQAIDLDNSDSVNLEEFRVAIKELMEHHKQEEEEEAQLTILNRSAFKTELQQDKLDQETYDVTKFYWGEGEGYCQAVARDERFGNFTLGVICFNAIYIGVDIQYNRADNLLDAHWVFILNEILFCVFFSFEICARFGAFKHKLNCLKDGWFKFDSLLVMLMVLETCVFPFLMPLVASGSGPPPTGMLRLLRLLRLSRMVRLMRSVPELVTIIKGIYVAVRAVASTFIMVIMLIYIFAILLTLLLRDDEATHEYFGTLGWCMYTLYVQGMLGDSPGALMRLLVDGNLTSNIGLIVFFIFVMLTTVTVLNLLVGVLVDVVATVAETEKEESETNVMKEQILTELKRYDDGDGEISEAELNEVMVDPASVHVLEAIGVDVNFLQTLQVMSYEDPDATVTITELLEQMLMCRRQSAVTMKHLILQQSLTIWTLTNKIMQHEKRVDMKLDKRFDALLGEMQHLHRQTLKQPQLAIAQQPQKQPPLYPSMKGAVPSPSKVVVSSQYASTTRYVYDDGKLVARYADEDEEEES